MRRPPGNTTHLAQSVGRRARAASDAGAVRLGLALLAGLWLVILFDVQWLLNAWGVTAALKAPVGLFVGLLAALGLAVLSVRDAARRWTWYGPLLWFVLVAALAGVFAPNLIRARDAVQFFALYWTLVVGTVVLVDSARRAELLLLAYGLQFLWWGAWGARAGLVNWDPVLANYDGFGAWMVIGGGFCSFLALATRQKWLKLAMAITVGLCVVGVVASFARGAFISAVAVATVVWLRSPKKGKALAWGVVAVTVLFTAETVLHGGEYWAEIASAFDEGTEEGTGEDRWVMWQAGFEVFLHRPILGAGPENWGVWAAENFQPGEVGGVYSANPGMLYGRSLHSYYVQVLSEHGILGVFTFLWILVDFWKRNAVIRSPEAALRWQQLGGRLALRPLALGIEAALIGWMGAAAFYSLAGAHWFFTILGLNLLLHQLVTRGGLGAAPKSPGRGRRITRPLMRPQLAGAAPGGNGAGYGLRRVRRV